MKNFKVFFSWQSNKIDISKQIRKSLRKFSKDNGNVTIDEATRDRPGSPNIPMTILNKINGCDIFICDLTTITNEGEDCFPNSNVMFELGYAVKTIGWERIICLLQSGNDMNHYPFDINRQRLSTFSNDEQLDNLVKVAIEAIIKDYDSILDRFNKDSINYKNEIVFKQLNEIFSESEILDVLHWVPNNLFIRYENYKKIDDLIAAFACPSNKFLTNRLNELFLDFLNALQRFEGKCVTSLVNQVFDNVEYNERSWKYPDFCPSHEIIEEYNQRLQNTIDKLCMLSKITMEKYELFILEFRKNY